MPNNQKKITFDDCAFKPQRQRMAEFLTEFLVEERQGYVLNLNGSWGVGKTHFLKSWQNQISEQHPVVYINAWKTDFADDPMLVVVNSIIQFFKEGAGGKIYEQEKALLSASFQLSKHLLTGLGGTLGGVLGSAVGGPAGAITGAVYGKEVTTQAIKSVDKKISKSAAEKHFENYRNKIGALEQFEKRIQEWVDCYMARPENNQEYPILVFVDELDRCRPSYAIEMLETVKHMFSLENFVFVIATDTEQLQHSIKSVYGQGFDSRKYLTRFFDQSFQLPVPSVEQYLTAKKYFVDESLFEVIFIGPVYIQSNECLLKMVATFSEAYNLSLREVDKLVTKLQACFRHLIKTNKKSVLNLVCLIYSILEYQRDRTLYAALPTPLSQIELEENLKLPMDKYLWFGSDHEETPKLAKVITSCFSMQRELDAYVVTPQQYGRNGEKDEMARRLRSVVDRTDWLHSYFQENAKNQFTHHCNWSLLKDLVEMSGSFES